MFGKNVKKVKKCQDQTELPTRTATILIKQWLSRSHSYYLDQIMAT